MAQIAVIVSRCVFVFLAFASAWNIWTGEAVRPLHPLNLTASAALVVGLTCVWFTAIWTRVAASVAGFVVSAITALQYFIVRGMFGDEAQFRVSVGPVVFEGRIAEIIGIAPAVVLLVSSGMVVWRCADELDRKKKEADPVGTDNVGAARRRV